MRAAVQEKLAAVRAALLKGNLAFVRVGGREYAVDSVRLRQHLVEIDVHVGRQTLFLEPDEIGPVRIVESPQ